MKIFSEFERALNLQPKDKASLARIGKNETVLLHLVKARLIRIIGSKRKRKLQKAGRPVHWCMALECWVWVPGEV